MALLGRMRQLAKTLICLDFLVSLSLQAAFCLLGLIGAAIYLFSGEYNEAKELGASALVLFGGLAFVWVVARNIRKHVERPRKDSDSLGQGPGPQDIREA